MKVLVVGGGGREHALTWGLARSPLVTELHVAPGNAGIAQLATCHDVAADDVEQMVKLVDQLTPDLVVVGPEAPLVAGLADRVRAIGIPVFGPGADAARLEGSKAWSKQVMEAGAIPTARAGTFIEVGPAVAFVRELGGRAVVKADGLAAGKGVTVAMDPSGAEQAIRDCLEGGAFGEAGETVVVEELLEGPEVSSFALVADGRVVHLGLSQDFKRIGDGDTGPNTGGMGAYSPLPFVDQATEGSIEEIADRTVATLASMGIAYSGLLYTGVMLTADGPKVLEYNCRFGDPETEVIVPRLAGDLATLLMAVATDRPDEAEVVMGADAAVTVVAASGGYPGSYETGVPITGLDAAAEVPGAVVFHAGTAQADGRVVTAGGRVLSVTGTGASIGEARDHAYAAVARVSFEGMTTRTDIAQAAATHREGT